MKKINNKKRKKVNKTVKKENKKISSIKTTVRKRKTNISKKSDKTKISLDKKISQIVRSEKDYSAKIEEKPFDPFDASWREKEIINSIKDDKKAEMVEKFLAKPDIDQNTKDVLPVKKIKEKLEPKILHDDLVKKNESLPSKDLFLNKIIKTILSPFKIFWLKQKIKRKHLKQDSNEHFEDLFAPQVKFFGIILPFGWQKALVIFLVISILLILPVIAMTYLGNLFKVKENIIDLSKQAYNHLDKGQSLIASYNFIQAQNEFNQAATKFNLAKQEISDINLLTFVILKSLPKKNQTLDIGLNFLSVGQNLSNAGYYLLDGINLLFEDKNSDLTTRFSTLNQDLSTALINIAKAQDNIFQINSANLNELEFDALTLAANELPKVETKLQEFTYLSQAMIKFLGQEQWQRYLLIFQNNNEIRATGGFMGSYALIDVDKGKIKNLEIPAGGTYDLQGQLKVAVASPQPLNIINPRWEFQDANWWPDFPTTAQKIIWFYENADGPTVDGVIAVTSSLMEDLLQVTGPITMPEYGRIISYENFETETQKIVELEYDREENKPKQFLSDLAPKILEQLSQSDKEDFFKLIEVLYKNLQQKNIMFYFRDPQLQQIAQTFNWAGQLQETDSDYLAVISSNIAGAKTDAVIKTKISHKAEILENGQIIDTLVVTKIHQGQKPNIFAGVQNNDYLRVYVPKGSTLLLAEGFSTIDLELFENTQGLDSDISLALVETDTKIESASQTKIYNESEKTVFANWFQIEPGEEKSVTLKYKLPIIFDSQYSMLVQKQAGKDDNEFSSQIDLDQNYNTNNLYSIQLSNQNNILNFQNTINKDTFYGFSLE